MDFEASPSDPFDPSELLTAAESAAPDPNRLMPAERTYPKTDKTVNVNQAIALLQQRRRRQAPVLEGGLDDTSPKVSLRKTKTHSPTPTPTGTVESPEFDGFTSGALPEDKASSQKDEETDKNDKNGKKNTNGRKKTLPVSVANIAEIVSRLGLIEKLLSKLQKPQLDAESDPLTAFKAQSHRAKFLINGMTVAVKCLQMTRDPKAHSLVLAFPDNDETFFTPPIQSELSLEYDGERIGDKLFYFGMCFTLRELGLKFLGFLYEEANSNTQEVK